MVVTRLLQLVDEGRVSLDDKLTYSFLIFLTRIQLQLR